MSGSASIFYVPYIGRGLPLELTKRRPIRQLTLYPKQAYHCSTPVLFFGSYHISQYIFEAVYFVSLYMSPTKV